MCAAGPNIAFRRSRNTTPGEAKHRRPSGLHPAAARRIPFRIRGTHRQNASLFYIAHQVLRQAFSVMLTRMEHTLSPKIPLMLARLAVLREHGMLSDAVPYPDMFAPLFRCAADADAPWPEIDETALNRIDGWIETRCRMLAV